MHCIQWFVCVFNFLHMCECMFNVSRHIIHVSRYALDFYEIYFPLSTCCCLPHIYVRYVFLQHEHLLSSIWLSYFFWRRNTINIFHIRFFLNGMEKRKTLNSCVVNVNLAIIMKPIERDSQILMITIEQTTSDAFD